MLDFIYYPVSFILWCWHWVFGQIFGEANAVSWILAIIFLTFTVRGIMFKPFVNQVRSMKKMQDFAPEMKKVQKKYANDRQRQAMEMQKLQKEHGVNPLGSCLPMLLQIPVFIGLNHVLRMFTINPVHPGQPKTENYFFSQSGVESYINAKLFGVNLGDAIYTGVDMVSGGNAPTGFHWHVAPVAIPLMIVASIATHLTARHSVQRQNPESATPQTAMMNKLTMYIFPFGVLIFGALFPIGLLIYWLANNGWTLMQQRLVYTKIDKEEEARKEAEKEKRANLGPKPGQKPTAPRPGQKPVQQKRNKQSSGGQVKKAGSPHGFAQTGSSAAEKKDAENASAEPSTNGSKENGADVPGLISDSTKKSGRKRR
ncbi:membrane protein insertase YidC [Amycolatopsis sp. BJA-103]|uniref:membrane protein insertase YidC n=1 Tax=unclassified Amycolatopsis TaxID=2618356 RepID=UPI000C75A4FA|nr:membrane protein insertase YidC [Amycolatopsis sp. BJA-103]AUI62677.1 membrane protein insertase YidC [Amycolatopsis sp. BJA-103]PNE18515.1 membrane protein insertase YidC [Amycolatopsis sp. BJA-103]